MTARYRQPRAAPFDDLELAQLRRLVDQAFDLRESGYLHDAVAAIEHWYLETLPDRQERAAWQAREAG